MHRKSFLTLLVISLTVCFASANSLPADSGSVCSPPLSMSILSKLALDGIAGDYVTVSAEIKNISAKTITNITTYLSLADEETKLPVDLEDWSAEKGLFIGTIDAGQKFPLEWKIHFVKAGKYSLIIIAEIQGETNVLTSRVTHFAVSPKHNLNPGQVLPVALGMPLFLLVIMMFAAYTRRSRLMKSQ
ncbi:MAG: hypothetical protein PHC61_07425 [Chitinivibrionales bacterium]|nr:hypothetical protein [Chitinivibrionales bacterium]